MKKGVGNIEKLCAFLDSPEKRFPSVHLAGTNGKGSSSHMLAAVLQTAGYKTGLYTSPHLKSFTERIRINGRPIAEDFVVDFTEKIRPAIDEISPSFFEITVAMAFDYFAAQKVDIAIVETGLGGRLDSTNVIEPELSLVTNIALDHQQFLGETLAEIAGEKAGIFKAGRPAVLGEKQPEIVPVFERRAAEIGSELYFAEEDFSVKPAGDFVDVWRENELFLNALNLDLKGDYQQKNLPGVLKSLELLAEKFPHSPADLRKGLESAARLTGLHGRWEKIGSRPTIICDTGHNSAGMQHIVNQIIKEKFAQLRLVLGMMNDKDHEAILRLFPPGAICYFCRPNIPRAAEPEFLAEIAKKIGFRSLVFGSVAKALEAAKKAAGPDDFIFVGGSTFTVADLPDSGR